MHYRFEVVIIYMFFFHNVWLFPALGMVLKASVEKLRPSTWPANVQRCRCGGNGDTKLPLCGNIQVDIEAELWKLKMMHFCWTHVCSKGLIFSFHVKLQECSTFPLPLPLCF